jgi:hypothetical protein
MLKPLTLKPLMLKPLMLEPLSLKPLMLEPLPLKPLTFTKNHFSLLMYTIEPPKHSGPGHRGCDVDHTPSTLFRVVARNRS